MKTKKIELKNTIKGYQKAIAMNCLDCVCCQPKEVIICQLSDCPLYPKRPKELKGLYILAKQLRKQNPGFYEAKKD